MKYLMTIIAVFALSGCQTVALSNQETINTLQAQQLSSEDPGLHLELAKQYIAAADETASIEYYEKAIIELEKFSLKVPDHLGALLTRYQLHFVVTKSGNTSRDDDLFKTFNQLPYNVKETVEPPSLASVLYHLQTQGFSNSKLLRELLHKSIKEQPKSTKSHIILANLYAYDGRYALAIPLMDKATKLDPENGHLHKEFGELLLDKEEGTCFYDVESPYKQALIEFRAASKLIPDDPDVHSSLNLIYSRLGRHFLAINEAKKLDQLQNDNQSKLEIADTYFYAGKIDDAEKIYISILESGKHKSPYLHKKAAQFYLAQQNWNKASKLWRQYFDATSIDNIYNQLSYSYSQEQLHGRDKALNEFKTSTSQYALSQWERKLRAFRLGELSKEDLYSSANTQCDYTEANFIIGMNELLQDNKEAADKYFSDALTYKAYGFVEYAVARELLKSNNE